MSSTPAPAPTFEQLFVDQAQATTAAIKRAAALHQKAADQAAQAEALIPGVVDALIAARLIPADHAEKAAAELRDPVVRLELLKLAADRFAGLDQLPLGQPLPPAGKQASTSSAGGAASRRGLRDSDRGFLAAFNLAPPG